MGTKQSNKPAQTRTGKNNNKVEERPPKQTRAQTKPHNDRKKRTKHKKVRRRMFPIGLRIIVVLLLAAGALIVGAMIGYGVLGDGLARDVFNMETWQHVIDIVTQTK